MTEIFGAVAADYDAARPGYPVALAEAILAYHGGPPARLVEVGAGTGLATGLLAGLGTRLTCVEPDARMAAVLAARFPEAEVVVARFEEWTAPPAGVPMLACALAWHWLDPATRNRGAHDALVPGGTLAVFAHRYDYVDPAQATAIRAAFESVDPVPHHDPPEDWFHADIAGSGLFADVRSVPFRRAVPLTTAAYQRLVGTFSPQLRRPPELRERVLAAIGAAVDGFGGTVTLDLRTTLVLARRPD
ncbi:methyltransferase domain-containing protein [Micromonospora sp. NPDC092111]|uniref:methyltransferase domain-containing protein n=1 Tax=Micromonospora sp. NPDC092111 TaxID=3364289 RepID=UPI003816AB44